MIVFASHEDGEMFSEDQLDEPDSQFIRENYSKYEIPDEFTLKAKDVLGHYGNLIEVLLSAGVMKSVE